MMVAWTCLLGLGVASAAPLQFHAEQPPQWVADRPELGPGAVRLRFSEPAVEVDALGAVVVSLRPGAVVPADLLQEGSPLGVSKRTWRVLPRASEGVIAAAGRWSSHPAVSSVMPDLILPKRQTSTFDDPEYGGQWYLDLLQMEDLYEASLGDPSVIAVVVDSAVEIDHPDLAAGIADPYDAFDDDSDPSPNPGEYCFDGNPTGICDEHGTAVSGIVAARVNNGEGIVGMCPECTLVPVKLLGEGNGALSRDVASFEHAIAVDAAVINNSWGYIDSIPVPEVLAEVIHRAATETRGGLGAVVVFAAGNDDRSIEDDEIQALEDVICVSATDRYGLPTAYTNEGASVDVAAPSATVTTTVQGGYTYLFGGTSAASPVVAGLAAWILSVDPSLSAQEVRQLIIDTAVPSPQVQHDESGHHPVYGYGEIRPTAILAELIPEEDPPVEEEPPKGCACSTGAGVVLGWPLWGALLWTRRRRAGRK